MLEYASIVYHVRSLHTRTHGHAPLANSQSPNARRRKRYDVVFDDICISDRVMVSRRVVVLVNS